MKKRVLYLLCMAFAMMAWLPPQLWAQTQPSGGDGSSESPFLITTAEELKWYANYVNGESGDNVVHTTACAQLVKDIDLSTVCGEGKGNWTPIAKYGIYKFNGEYHFDGVFDGNGHTISNLYINDKNGSNLGLFGYVNPTTEKTSVKNLKMASVQIVGKTDIAAVCASGYNATFENIEVISGSITGFSDIYGISGCRGSVKNCINRADVTAGSYNVAGVISTIQDEASNCSNYGKITTGTGWAGGIAGGSDGMTTILNCANYGEIHVTGTVNSTDCAVGGLLGSPWNLEISNCANFGNIYLTEQSEFVGTIVGTSQLKRASGILANTGNIYVGNTAPANVPVLQSGIKWFEDNVDNTATCITPTAEQLASGWLAWQLQLNCGTPQTWGQDLEQENSYPVLNGKTVYFSGSKLCNGHLLSEAYTNDQTKETATPAHSQEYEDGGFCTVCHESRELHGKGTANDPYLISNVAQLEYFRDQSNEGDAKITAYAQLVNDIDLAYASASSWIPVSKLTSNAFAGTFDGGGHCIKNLYSSFYQGGYVGLFGYVNGATIKNLTVEGVIESSCANQGMIAGQSVGANFYNCVAKGRINTSGSADYVGGITGWVTRNSPSIPVVRSCASYVDIVSTGTFAGGIIGKSNHSIIMEACANYGNVTGTANVGGLMGYTDPQSDSHITNCYVGSCEVRGTGSNVFLTCYEPSGNLSNFEKVFYSKDAKVFASADATEPEDLASRIAYGDYNTSSAFVGFTAEQIAGGEATYCMNNETTVLPVWTQDLKQANSQPELNGDAALHTVYKMGYLHGSNLPFFSNNQDFENTLHPEADNNGSHDEAYRYVPNRHGSRTHSATCSVCGYFVESQDCTFMDDFCIKCNYGVLDLFELADGEAYTLANGAEVGELNYARNFGGTNWTTWYVPFELKLTPELCQKYAFSRINNVHQYDDNNDGVADRTIVESFNQAEGVTLKANYPYLVRALTDADKKMTITLTEVELANAESKHIDCMSVDHTYTFTGTYNEMGDGGNEANSPLSLFDYSDGNMWLNFHSLPAQRHYLVITPRDGSTPTLAPARVMLQVIGDETVTGIVNLYGRDKRSAETYDLSGRRVGSNQRGLLIKNGKKVLVK